jgi:hypothetical protein
VSGGADPARTEPLQDLYRRSFADAGSWWPPTASRTSTAERTRWGNREALDRAPDERSRRRKALPGSLPTIYVWMRDVFTGWRDVARRPGASGGSEPEPEPEGVEEGISA